MERAFIRQLAEAGTLSAVSRSVGDSITFRAISVSDPTGSSSYTSSVSLARYNFSVIQNQNFLVDLILRTGTGQSLDLTEYSAIALQVKKAKGGSAIFEVALGQGLTISGADNNVLSIAFLPDQTRQLCGEAYYYDVMMVKPNGSKVYYVEGKINVVKTGTR